MTSRAISLFCVAGTCIATAMAFYPRASAETSDPNDAKMPEVTVSGLHPEGTPSVQQVSPVGKKYDGNKQYIEEGKALYIAFNCIGCHSNGGGGIGPPLTAHAWSYGSSIDNIAADLFEGRPNGMPAWRGKIPDNQIWAIAAFVRSLTPNGPLKPL